jgi:CelD/BcsL family acetyltransferase involved in cellulose biosynthesis
MNVQSDSAVAAHTKPLALDPAPLRKERIGDDSLPSFVAMNNRFKITIQRSFEGSGLPREKWDEAVVQTGGSVYMSYDWCRTWYRFYAPGKDLRIFVCSVEDEIVGILPVYIDAIGPGPLQFKVARLVGANIPPKAFNPPVRPECAEFMFEAVCAQLLQQDECDLVSIGPVCETRELLKHFENASRKQPMLATLVTRSAAGVHTLFRLPATMDEFFAAMDKDERKKRKYEMRLLNRDSSISKDVLSSPAEVEAEFQRFAHLHALQWRDKGKLGHFGSWPKATEYNFALLGELAQCDRVRFVRILSGGNVISSQYAFVFGNQCYWELPARAMDREWNRFSLGTTGFFALVEQAIKERKSFMEAGLAHYDYKQKLNGTEHNLEVLRMVRNRFRSKLSFRFYWLLRKCLEFLYHKVWYARISPRLPASFRKPIWSFWLRLDF